MKQKSLDREDESSVWILVVASFDNDERKPEPLITLAFKSRGDAMYALKKSKKVLRTTRPAHIRCKDCRYLTK